VSKFHISPSKTTYYVCCLFDTEEDFSQFNDDEVMVEVIKRIRKDQLAPKEHKFVSDLPLYEAYYGNLQRELDEMTEEAQKAQKAQKKALKMAEKMAKEAKLANEMVKEEHQKRQEEHQKLLKGIENLLQRGDTIESIADLLVRSVEEITDFLAQIEAKKA
jgi:hypothetical protein